MGRNAVDYRQPREGQASCTTPLGPGGKPPFAPRNNSHGTIPSLRSACLLSRFARWWRRYGSRREQIRPLPDLYHRGFHTLLVLGGAERQRGHHFKRRWVAVKRVRGVSAVPARLETRHLEGDRLK